MNKLLVFITCIIIVFIKIVSTGAIFRSLPVIRMHTIVYASDRVRYGDLFGFSYLPDFKIDKTDYKFSLYPKSSVMLENFDSPRCINLYYVCDCCLEYKFHNTLNLCGVKNQIRLINPDTSFAIDTTKCNILLIERIERLALDDFLDSNNVLNSVRVVSNNKLIKYSNDNRNIILKLLNTISKVAFDKLSDEHLEFTMFDYPIFTYFKELKAQFNYKFFDKVNKDVVVSSDKKQLIINELMNNSFSQIPDSIIDKAVRNLNTIYLHYKRIGFKEVYLSIIPEKVGICYSNMGNYNNMISRIYAHPKLKMPVIDVVDKFKKSKCELFLPSDSHWNNNAFYIWLNEFNNVLFTYINEHKSVILNNSDTIPTFIAKHN